MTATDGGQPDGGLADGANLVTIVPMLRAVDMAIGADDVYWTTGTEVMRAPLRGGDPVPLATAQNGCGALVVDSNSLYWTNEGQPDLVGQFRNGSVVSLALDGGAIVTLVSGQDAPGSLAVDDAGVYFTAGGTRSPDGGVSPASILSVRRTGGMPAPVVTGLSSRGPIAVSGGELAFAISSAAVVMPPTSQIGIVPTSGGATRILATSDHPATSVAVDANNVYWLDGSSNDFANADVFPVADGRVRSVPLQGGATAILADMQAQPAKVVVLGSALFWSALGMTGEMMAYGNASLWTLPTNGGAPTALVAKRAAIAAFAVDTAHLAWFEQLLDGTGDYELFVMNR